MAERTKRKQINVTRDYSMFTRDSDNRDVNVKRHRLLLASMKKHGFLSAYPIVAHKNGSGKWHIKDGQNRFTIAQSLDLPIHWVEDESDFDIAEINNTQVVWNLRDYAQKYSRNGIKEYTEAMEFSERHRLPIGLGFAMLAGTTTFQNIKDDYVSGKYRIRDRKWAESVAAVYTKLYALSKDLKHKSFLEAVMAVCRVEDFSATRLLQNAQRVRDKLVGYSNREANLDMLEEIYNYGRSKLFPLKISAITVMRERCPMGKGPKRKVI